MVKAIYLLLFICFRMLQCTYLKTPRIGFLTQSFPPRGKLPSFFPHFIGGECLHFEYFQSGAFLENGPRKIPQDYQSSNLPKMGCGNQSGFNRKILWIMNIQSWWSFKLDFESELNIFCIWILVIKFIIFQIMDTHHTLTNEEIPLKNTFLQPDVLTLAEGAAVPLHRRLSLGP